MANPGIYFQQRPSSVKTGQEIAEERVRLGDLRTLAESRRQTVRENEMRLTALQRDEEENTALDEIWTRHQGNLEAAMPELMVVNPDKALKLQGSVYDNRAKLQQHVATELKTERERLNVGRQIALSIKDENSFKEAQKVAVDFGPEMVELLGTEYDPDRVQQIQMLGDEMEREQAKKELAHQNFLDGKYMESMGGLFSLADDEEEWQEYREMFKGLGIEPSILAAYPEHWSPEAQQEAARSTMTPAQEADLALKERQADRQDRGLELDERAMADREANTDMRRQELMAARASGGLSGRDGTERYYNFLLDTWAERHPEHEGTPPASVREEMMDRARQMSKADKMTASGGGPGGETQAQRESAIEFRRKELNDLDDWRDEQETYSESDEIALIQEYDRRRQSIEQDYQMIRGLGASASQAGDINLPSGPGTMGDMMPGAQGGGQTRQSSYGMVMMEAPDGTQDEVPAEEVERFEAAGARVVQ